jgi:hypothetical protein
MVNMYVFGSVVEGRGFLVMGVKFKVQGKIVAKSLQNRSCFRAQCSRFRIRGSGSRV